MLEALRVANRRARVKPALGERPVRGRHATPRGLLPRVDRGPLEAGRFLAHPLPRDAVRPEFCPETVARAQPGFPAALQSGKVAAMTTPNRGRWWRWLGRSFLAGALLDLGFGLAVLLVPGPAAGLLGVTLVDPAVYLDLNGLFLVALGGIYLLIFRQPQRLAPVAVVATWLRFAGCALFAADVATGRADPVFALIAALDGSLALIHFFLLRRAAGSLVNALGRWETPLSPNAGEE